MKSNEEALDRFSKVVLEKAFSVRNEMEKDVKMRIEKSIEKEELQILEEAYNKIQKEKARTIQEVNEKISTERMEYKKKLIMRRTQIAEEIFDKVIEKINEFINSDNYWELLLKNAEKAIEALTDGVIFEQQKEEKQTFIISINKSDEQYKERLEEKMKEQYNNAIIEVQITNEDIVGGVTVYYKEKNAFIDYSIRNSINGAKKQFLKVSGLSIE